MVGLLFATQVKAFDFNWFANIINPKVTDVYIEQINTPTTYNFNRLPLTRKINILSTDNDAKYAGQCIGYIRYITGVDFTGNWEDKINSNVPILDAIVVMRVGRWGHKGIVSNITENKVTIRSRNWEGLWIISDNKFDIDDIRIVGYITY